MGETDRSAWATPCLHTTRNLHNPAITRQSSKCKNTRGGGGGGGWGGGGEYSNSKTLILKDSSVRSIWTYLTASPCYTTNTNKHDEREREREREREMRERERERGEREQRI